MSNCYRYQKQKKDILFVGTLYKGKGVDVLLETYKQLVLLRKNVPHLTIVGDGTERINLEDFVKMNNLIDNVTFCGAIYDEVRLSSIFQRALLSVSPYQAGLSVPKSMGYGVPYATRKDAITGGEIYHIKDKDNGFMYENDHELLNILIDATDNPQKFIDMGFRAKEYYDNNATVKHRSNGAISAFRFALGI